MNSSSPGFVLAIENERCSPSWPGTWMSTYCPGLNTNGSSSSTRRCSRRMSLVSSSTASTRVVTVADRRAGVQDLLVVVDELDLEVRIGVRPAQQRPPLGLLEVGQRERRVAVEVDVAVEQERLARRALTLLAAVHEHEPCRKAALRIVSSSSTSISRPTGSNRTVCVFPMATLGSRRADAGSPLSLASRPPPDGPPGRPACTRPCGSRAPRETSR